MPYTTFTGRGSCLGPHVRTLLIHTECFILFVRDRFRSIDERLGETRQSQSTASSLSVTCARPQKLTVYGGRGLCAPVQGEELLGTG
jgi:hypothetical protein